MRKNDLDAKTTILTDIDLKSYFYSKLLDLNKKSLAPVHHSVIFYTSEVLNRFVHSEAFFDVENGRYENKVLGTKLLEANHMNRESRKQVYKEVGDTALCLCGFFSNSLKRKIVDPSYYESLGQSAYLELNSMIPDCLDTPAFFKMLSGSFGNITSLLTLISDSQHNETYSLFVGNQFKIGA